MPLADMEIVKLRKQVADKKQRRDALEIIVKLDPKNTVPVIIKILSNIKAADTAHTEATINYINYGEKVLNDTDEKQNASIFTLPTVLKGVTKEKITADMQKLVNDASMITVTSNTVALWKEVEIWLEGWFRRTYDTALKKGATNKDYELLRDEDGAYKTIDLEDKAFRKIIGLTKYSIAINYHRLAEVIAVKIKEYEATLKDKAKLNKQPSVSTINAADKKIQPQKLPEKSVDTTIAEVKATQQPGGFVPSGVQVKPTKEGYTIASVYVPDGQQEKLDGLRKAMSIISDANKETLQTISVMMDVLDADEDLVASKIHSMVKRILAIKLFNRAEDLAQIDKLVEAVNAMLPPLPSAVFDELPVIATTSTAATVLLPAEQLSPSPTSSPSSDESAGEPQANVPQETPCESLYDTLHANKDESDDVRFSMMLAAIEECKLNERELCLIREHISPKIKAKVGSYLSSWFTTNGVPTLFKSRTHTDLATHTINVIATSNDPKEDIKALYSMWLDTEGKNSVDLHKKAVDLLDMAYKMLLSNGKQQSRESLQRHSP